MPWRRKKPDSSPRMLDLRAVGVGPSPSSQKPAFSKKHIIIGISIIPIFVIAIAAFMLLKQPYKKTSIPTQRASGFSTYYPSRLPKGYAIDASSVGTRENVFVYVINRGDKKIFVTVQKLQPNFDYNSFNSTAIKPERTLKTRYGAAYLGTLGDKRVSSLVTDDAWILMSGSADFDDLDTISRYIRSY